MALFGPSCAYPACGGTVSSGVETDSRRQCASVPTKCPPATPPSESVKNATDVTKPLASKPAGAYRPPGARGLATPAIFKREDEGGPTGNHTPPRAYSRSPANGTPNGHHNGNGLQNGRRHVPGAAPKNPPPGATEGDKDAERRAIGNGRG